MAESSDILTPVILLKTTLMAKWLLVKLSAVKIKTMSKKLKVNPEEKLLVDEPGDDCKL